jgi:adenylate cyclase
VTRLDVPLESIRSAFQGVIPSPVATASAAGEPHSTYLSIVWYVDEERIALSNQFMGTTVTNLRENPEVVLRVVDPASVTEYEIAALHLHSETSGPVFEAMRTQLEVVAEQSGMQDVFRLRSAEILRVTRCEAMRLEPIDGEGSAVPDAADWLAGLEVFGRRVAGCGDLDEATRLGLELLEDLFGIEQSMLLLSDATEERLLVVATNGYRPSGIGAEIGMDEGVIGAAATRRQQVAIGNIQRTRTLAAAISDDLDAIPLPGLPDAQSVIATPMVVGGSLVGVLYVDSPQAGQFGAERARLIEVVAGTLGLTVSLLDPRAFDHSGDDDLDAPPSPRRATRDRPVSSGPHVVFHERDGSFFLDGDYVIKGVPGRILFAILREHEASGRSEFTNRELRLDRSIGLPAGKDNLESRLLALRRRLAERDGPIRLERTGRGRLRVDVDQPLRLTRRDD